MNTNSDLKQSLSSLLGEANEDEVSCDSSGPKRSVKHEEKNSAENKKIDYLVKKRKYSIISQKVREEFIKRVLSREATIKQASQEFGLKFSTSKAILQTYKREGRIGKKKNRDRKTRVINTVVLAAGNPLNPTLIPLASVEGGNTGKKGQSGGKTEENQEKIKANIERDLINESQLIQFQRNIVQAQLQQSLIFGATQVPSLTGFNSLPLLPRSSIDLGLLNHLSRAELQRPMFSTPILQEFNYYPMVGVNQVLHQMRMLQNRNEYSASLMKALGMQNNIQAFPTQDILIPKRDELISDLVAPKLKVESLTESTLQTNGLVFKDSLPQRISNHIDCDEYGSKPYKKICH